MLSGVLVGDKHKRAHRTWGGVAAGVDPWQQGGNLAWVRPREE